MTSILVVCTGNICRSPLAEGFLRSILVRRFAEAAPRVSSAGTAGGEGSPAMAESVQAASERDVDISGHLARKLGPHMVEHADLVLCMAREHRDAIIRANPAAEPRVFTLKELVRLLEALPPPANGAPEALVDRVAQASAEREAGFKGNPLDEDIADPLSQPLEAYRGIAWELDTWSLRLAEGLFGKAEVPTSIFGEAGR
jgi:protein-tyrosine phosphatase